jgi:uncharacterized protein YdaU (DUF1376 family)
MSKIRAVMFNFSDFLNDPHVRIMTLEERGAYITLMGCSMHEGPPGTLPNDDSKLCRYVGLTIDGWERIKDGVMAAWRPNEDGRRWVQKRLCEEIEKAVISSEKQAARVRARWEKPQNARTPTEDSRYYGEAIPRYNPGNATVIPNTGSAVIQQEQKQEQKQEQCIPPNPLEGAGVAGEDFFSQAIPVKPTTKGKARSEEEVLDFINSDSSCQRYQLNGIDAEWFWNKMEGNGWTNAGEPVRSWKSTIRQWVIKDEIFPTRKRQTASRGKSINGHPNCL